MENFKEVNFEEFKPSADDFTLAQSNIKIHDQKFQTKTTTYAKDAFKRFCKNKSSVVAAFIIGFLILCSIFVPIISPYETDTPQPTHNLLRPKLFKAGTGFWDGTEDYSNITWDAVNECPSGFNASAVVEGTLKISQGEMTDTPHVNAIGGYLRFVAEQTKSFNEETKYSKTKSLYNYTPFNITADGNYEVEITLGNVDNIAESGLGEYRISLVAITGYGANKKEIVEHIADLQTWTTDHAPVYIDETAEDEELRERVGVYKFNLSQCIADLGIETLENARIKFEVVQETTPRYMLIESIEITADIENPEEAALLESISMADANANILNGQKDKDTNKFPIGYWQSTGQRKLYQATIGLVSFTYDTYEAQLGLMKDKVLGQSEIDQYIANGWMKYDYEVGVESFEILDYEKCPIVSISKQEYSDEFEVYNITTDIIVYKYQGFDKMPKYIFGATKEGKDLLTLSFVSLRTSLIIAFLSSFICLAIGLVWGSISGYFGGNVDLAMERFCEILSGVPFIVVMTLVILHFGNTIGVFAFGLCITGWLGVAGRTRTQFYRFKGREYILASRTLGASDMRLIFKHILPNALGTIVTGSVLMIPSVIFSEASLSYLNLGLQGVESFGVLLSKNQGYLKTYPMLILFPASIISLLMISFNLFGNGLRDALNPTLKGSE